VAPSLCALPAGVLDFWLLEVFEAGRGAMWSALGHPPTRGPALFLYSRQDPLVRRGGGRAGSGKGGRGTDACLLLPLL
jgi:hypothetical protein